MRRREELKQSQVAARENKVTLFRRYRTGELPDIQRVSMAAFLGPLGMALTPCTPGGTEQCLTAWCKHHSLLVQCCDSQLVSCSC